MERRFAIVITKPVTEENAQSKRPWHRPHASTIVVACLLTAALFLIVVPGELVNVSNVFEFGSSTPYLRFEFEHGWPWTFLQRTVKTPTVYPPDPVVPWLHRFAWSSLGFPSEQIVSWATLALDILVVVIALAAVVALFEFWRRRRRRLWQFGLCDVAVAVVAVACGLAWWRAEHHAWLIEDAALEQLGGEYRWSNIYEGYSGPRWMSKLVERHRLPLEFWAKHSLTIKAGPGEAERIRPHLDDLRHLRKI